MVHGLCALDNEQRQQNKKRNYLFFSANFSKRNSFPQSKINGVVSNLKVLYYRLEEMKAGARGNMKKAVAQDIPSIFSRPFDLLLCFVFLVKAIIAAYSDIMNAIGKLTR